MTLCWYIYNQTLVVSNNSMVLGRKTNNEQNNIPFLLHYHCTNNSHLLINVCQFVFKHTKSKRLCFKVFDERFDCTICILRFLQLSHSPSNPTLWIIYELTKFYISTLDILFLSNHNIHKSSLCLCFWASDPLIEKSIN